MRACFTQLCGLVWVALAVTILGMLVTVVGVLSGHGELFGLARRFDARAEATVHAWLGSTLLLGSALVLFFLRRVEPVADARRAWTVLSAGFALLSLDETAAFHELFLVRLSKRTLGQDSPPHLWAVLGLAGVAVAAYYVWPLIRTTPTWFKRRLSAAGGVYVGGAVGVELLGGVYGAYFSNVAQYRRLASYQALAVLEESMELVGAALCLMTLLALLATHSEAGDPQMSGSGKDSPLGPGDAVGRGPSGA